MSVVLRPVVSTWHDIMYYNMNHPKRGIALIFNHREYRKREDGRKDERRYGTDLDCDALETCLTELHFDIQICEDFSYDEILQKLEKVSAMDHTEHDCLFVAVLTHGELDEFWAYDKSYNSDTIWPHFTADKCKTLAGKPKIFVIQACQGSDVDDSIILRQRTVTDCSSPEIFGIANEADFLIAYATPPGYVAWRSKNEGSCFILALCSELKKHGKEFDLVTLFTMVSQRVTTEYESGTLEKKDKHGKKQIPCIGSRLTRLIQF